MANLRFAIVVDRFPVIAFVVVRRRLLVEASVARAATCRDLAAIRTLLANTVKFLPVWLGQQPFFANLAPRSQFRVLFYASFVSQDAVDAAPLAVTRSSAWSCSVLRIDRCTIAYKSVSV